MSKRKNDKIKISFVGENASEVTGSMTLIEYQNKKMLVDTGLYQSNSLVKDYRTNSKKLSFKANEIDYIWITHINADHFCLLPRLYKEGCTARIITHHKSVEFFEPMLLDSAHIMERDVMILHKQMPNALPIYDEQDVYTTLPYIRGYDEDVLYELDDNISFKMSGAGHIIGAMQTSIYIKTLSGHVEKLSFSGDIGNTLFNNPFVEKFKPIKNCSVFIGECTYGSKERSCVENDRDKDIEKLQTVIRETCIDGNGRVFIPCFALQRTQTMLKILYDIYGQDKNFKLPIIVDSPLAIKLTNVFSETLTGEEKILMDKIINWKNVKFIKSPEESIACVKDKSPKIILASSGMVQNGRSVHWAKSILPKKSDALVMCGFMVEGSLGWRIKNGRDKSRISIQGVQVGNRCGVINLRSFSSHMQNQQLIDYYKSINTDTIYLVHGNMSDKLEFKKQLEEELRKINKTTRVVVVNKGTKINL